MYFSSLLPSMRVMPPLEIDISAYAPSYIFYSMDVPNDPLLKAYEKELLGPTGLGTTCARYPEKCTKNKISSSALAHAILPEDTAPCPCASGKYSCPADALPNTPPSVEMSSGDRLYNLTGRNITNWIVKTELAESYIRYGGISFGYPRSFNTLGLFSLIDIFRVSNLMPFISAFGRRADQALDTSVLDKVTAEDLMNVLMIACSKEAGEKKLEESDINDNIIIWYNNRGWISGIAFMNAVSNLVLRASLPKEKDSSNYYIRLINHPMPITARQLEDELEKQSNVSLLRAITVIWALAFIPATYAVYLIGERASGFKHLQIITGVGKVMYWAATFFWDFTCFVLTILILVLIFICYQDDAFTGRNSIVAFLVLMCSYAAVSITSVYPLSFFFNVPSSGFVAVSTINIFIAMITLLTTFVMSVIQDEEDPYYLNTIFLIFPQFCLGKALLNMSIVAITVKTLATFGVTENPRYFGWELIMKYVTCMLILAVVFFLVTLALEFKVFKSLAVAKASDEYVDVDDDVRQERLKVAGASQSDYVLLLRDLSKWYRGQARPAVDRLSLGVPGGQCFGLLGLNGAGKTTVFKMLTGNLSPTSGSATVLGEPIKDGYKLGLGYCPQGNALDPFLTCEEHLTFFARLHGLQGTVVNQVVAKNIERLGIEIHRSKMAKALSGGNKRKLNTALALVGEPRLVLLDEPTSGMDPRARRFLWQCVQKCVLDGQCVVLTSHSMEECQTLCTRLSIMVNGRFRCLGTCQHLKSKFDEGYSITVRVPSLEAVAPAQTYLQERLPTTGKLETNYLQVKLRLSPGTALSHVFSTLDAAKTAHVIQQYSISQTTLEQIFLSFAEAQGTSSESDKLGTSYIDMFCSCCYKQITENSSNEVRQRVSLHEFDAAVADMDAPGEILLTNGNGHVTHKPVRIVMVESAQQV